ncbi:hypothetical protein B0A52_09588 [Exophiala mesophila]|uniref:Histidine acid phosphatase n=1 Tax=Exophiala mesophila TaxID=212818 RepID=A0A438MT41_EXOME|nr:hypothetical protein B0A52_09588 [Exophiala mesophila]
MLPLAPLTTGFGLLALASLVAAQSGLKHEVLGAFIYTTYGDRTPFVFDTPTTLTPLGAHQLYDAGAKIRERYVTPIEGDGLKTTIRDISPFQLQYDQLNILTSQDQYVTGSAQAFLQGLYPPLETFSNYTYIQGLSTIENGTNLVAPLSGYQYPSILTVTSNDLNSIWLDGSKNCPAYRSAANDYYRTDAFRETRNQSQDFYQSLQQDFLRGHFPSGAGYLDAYYIYDYLHYANIHNTTVAELLQPQDLVEAKALAADWLFALNTNAAISGTSQNNIRAMAGRTLATRILQSLYAIVNTRGNSAKMTLLFGSFEPMISFASLAGLTSPQNAAFYNIPEPGSSFIFELYSIQAQNDTTYPDNDEIFVRFYYQNGTGSDSSLVEYPLFGMGPSQTLIPLSDFVSGIQRFMVLNVEEWCRTCNSYSVFCPAFVDNNGSLDPTTTTPASSRKGLSPAIAGVIGAVVTLVFAALLFLALALLAGFRVSRVHKSRKSDLGGFKGSERLASDQDLTIPKGGAGATVISSPDPAQLRGHERVGSWELREQAKAEEAQGRIISPDLTRPRRPSFEDDDMPINPFTSPVDPRHHV